MITASPSTRKRAVDAGLDIEALAARIGRSHIAHEDVDRAIANGGTPPAETGSAATDHARYWEVDHAAHGPVTEENLTRIAELTAANLSAANAMIPQVTHHDRADMRAVDTLRARLAPEARASGVRLTALAFHILALARTLRDFPRLNASLSADGKRLILKDYVHIGIAVDTPHGLVVPVIRNADQKGLWAIAEELSELARRAKDRKLKSEDMGGASVSLSSLGGIGGTAFTPIVNPPEVAIMGLTRTETVPVWNGDTFDPVPMTPISFTYDHRVLNGAEAARITRCFADYIAEPRRMTV